MGALVFTSSKATPGGLHMKPLIWLERNESLLQPAREESRSPLLLEKAHFHITQASLC